MSNNCPVCHQRYQERVDNMYNHYDYVKGRSEWCRDVRRIATYGRCRSVRCAALITLKGSEYCFKHNETLEVVHVEEEETGA